MSNWQPIETAPKDGTWVLLCGGSTEDGHELFCGSFTDPVKQAEREREIKEINSRPVSAIWTEDTPCGDAFWAYAAWDSGWRSAYENPTHWMPLPELPKELEP